MRWKLPAMLLPVLFFAGSVAWGADLSRVRSLVEKGRAQDALSDLDEHLAAHPVDPEAMFLRGLVLAEIRREQEAREAFQEVSDLRPDRPEPLNNIAVIEAAMGDYDQAVETLKEALRTHPAYRTAYENLTKIYGQLASEAYSRALSVEASHDRASLELVLLSDMVLEPGAPVRLAEAAPSQTPPAGSETSSAGAKISPPLPSQQSPDMDGASSAEAESGMDAEEAPTATPDDAIAEAMRQGRSEDMPSAEATPASAAAAPAELADLVEAWASAWSDQRVDDYLGFYSSSFRPAGELDLEAWRQQRRERLTAPEFVRVSVAFLDFDNTDPDRALVRFNQSYESDTFSDVVTKTLELVRQEGSWKIVRESVDS